MERAFALLNVKGVEQKRDGITIRGMATTPSPDRIADIVEPLGAKFRLPLPLFMYHDSKKTVGRVEFAKASKDGIPFEAFIPNVTEPGVLKDRVDESVHMLKYGLIGGVSIGFKASPDDVEFLRSGGRRFKSWEWLELSLVPIPANDQATISAVKSIWNSPAAHESGFAGAVKLNPARSLAPLPQSPKGNSTMTTKTLREIEADRAAKAAKMGSILQKAQDEGRTLDVEEQKSFDEVRDEVKAVDAHIERLREFENLSQVKSTPVPSGSGIPVGNGGGNVLFSKRNDDMPGLDFARYVRCLYMAKGNMHSAEQIAKDVYRDNPRVAQVFKATVVAGSTVSGTWAADLVTTDGGPFAEFLEYLRPMTIIGKIPNLRRVAFNAPVGIQTGAGAGYWVGQGKGKPLTSFDYDKTSLPPLTAANIVVVTKQLLKYASVNADTQLRDQLAQALAGRIDTDFIDPAKAASAGVSPASITNGVSAPNSAGNTADDVLTDMKTIISALSKPVTGLTFITDSATALALSLMKNSLGGREFPDVSMNGGFVLPGVPLIVSDYVPSVTAGSLLIGIKAPEILIADQGGFSIDMSEEATLEMTDTPLGSSVATVAASATLLVSMFQTNSVAFRCERDINWAAARSGAVALVDTVNYGE